MGCSVSGDSLQYRLEQRVTLNRDIWCRRLISGVTRSLCRCLRVEI